LERLQLQSDTLLDALSSDPVSSVTSFILQALKRGGSRESIALEINRMKADEARNAAYRPQSYLDNDIINNEPSASGSHYPVPDSTTSTMDDNCSSVVLCDITEASTTTSTELLGTVGPVPPNFPDPNLDHWTKSGWPKVYVRKLVDSVLEWDGMLFCLLWKDLFHKDFEKGGTQYCSSALVNALLALATRIKDEGPIMNQSLDFPQQRLNKNSDRFSTEAISLLSENGRRPNNLADIQALGVLALYKASCDREDETQRLASEFAAAIADLCLREDSAQLKDSSYERVRVDAYCGAISLLR
jgi:hypothetical protein